MKFQSATKLGIAAAVVAAFAALAVSPASAGAPVIPDLSIKEPGGAWEGDNLWGGAIGQSGFAKINHGQTAVFKIRVQNDGFVASPVTVHGNSGTTHFGVKYFKGQNNISKAVRQGSYTTPPLVSGEKKTIRMEIKAKTTTVTGMGFVVSGGSPGGVTDTVLAEVANCNCLPI